MDSQTLSNLFLCVMFFVTTIFMYKTTTILREMIKNQHENICYLYTIVTEQEKRIGELEKDR